MLTVFLLCFFFFLILDYLGCDHIGHKLGPFSSLMQPKLKEMNDVIRIIYENLNERNKNSEKKSLLFVTTDHGMRDEGGHSGNSYAETHIPLLILGAECESNRDIFYRQIDFAPTFSTLNGLPIPRASIGSLIPEMLINTNQIDKLKLLEKNNERLLKLLEPHTEEFKHEFDKAKSFHQMFLNDKENLNAFHQAEQNYLHSSRTISDELGRNSLEMNFFQVVLGLTCTLLIVITLMIPAEDDSGKDLKLTIKSFGYLFLVSLLIKLIIINEIFDEKNDLKSYIVFGVMMCVLRVIFGVLICKIDRLKKISLFDNDLLYMLSIGHVTYAVSVASSSFVEEEHQIWYYFCNSFFLIFSFIEIHKHRRSKFPVTSFKYIGLTVVHLIIRRINQTGDKWIKSPDTSDWLHQEKNGQYLTIWMILSLTATFVWLTKSHSKTFIKSLIIGFVQILLYIHRILPTGNR